jgi:FLVCR family feline leukemia virus subgroup C receptor-related protein
MEYIVKPFDFSLTDISNCILIGVMSGLMGDLIIGYIVKRTGKYRATIRFCNALTTVFFLLLIISLVSEVKPLFMVCWGMVCGSCSVMALTFELACEISFPVTENSTIAYLGLVGNLVNFLQSIPEIYIVKVLS